ncbi:MAG: M13 family peptidase, partial [Pyrinomonadaceae bacterium]
MISPFFRSVVAAVMVLSVWSTVLAQSSGFDTTRMDRSAEACDDFFQFANGTWIKNTEIPPSQSRWGSFNILSESNRDVLHEILDKAVRQKARAGTNLQLIGDFYASCMDEAAIERAGARPIQPFLAEIQKMRSIGDLRSEIAELHNLGIPALFRLNGGPDLKNSNIVIVNAGQAGLTLPNRDYYTK